MGDMKAIADQLREKIKTPSITEGRKRHHAPAGEAILDSILAFDTTGNKNMVHARFDAKTVRLMNQFKLATEVDVTRLVSFSVHFLFELHPELKTIIKNYLQNNEL